MALTGHAVLSMRRWNVDHIQRHPESIALFTEDIKYQTKAGFCRVFLWEDLKKTLPANFKISPVAVVPQVG